jgi:hypothetical protein
MHPMAMMPPTGPEATRRVVLVDFDWQDADLMPALLKQPGLSVGLVAGARDDEAGVRVAELCGVPRSIELADLTREIFDLALVSERSARRPQVERLLSALGTPVASPQTFLDHAATNGHGAHANGNGSGPDASAHVDPLSQLLAQAIPDLSTDAGPPAPHAAAEDPALPVAPGPDDITGLERALERWVAETGAIAAELHAGDASHLRRVCRVGRGDPLLEMMVRLALEHDAPQVVSRLDGAPRGQAWGAWPFRSRGRRAVLAASGIDPVAGRAHWEGKAQELRVAWEASRSTPFAPIRQAWIDLEEFRARLEPVVEHNRTEGQRWTLHRLTFAGPLECVEMLCRELPRHLRDSDQICLPTLTDVLLLTPGSPGGYVHIRRRLTALWEKCWEESGQRAPAPPIADERIELLGPEDADTFRAVANRWLTV